MKRVISIFLALSTLFLTGCWNYREIDSMAIVAGIAVDKGKNGSGYHLTFDTADVTGTSEKGSAKSELIETDGDTIFEAVRNATQKSDKKLYFGDCKVVLISKTIAEEGVAPLLDWLNRDSEVRLTVGLFVSRTDSAQEILYQKDSSNEKIVSAVIDQSAQSDSKYLSRDPYVELYRANNLLAGNGISLVLPFLKKSDDRAQSVQLDGLAIFKGDRLIGNLHCNDALSYMFIRDLVKGGVFLVKKDSDVPDISLEIFSCQSKITPVITEDHVKLSIHVKADVALDENESDEDFDTDEKIHELENLASRQLNQRLTELIQKVQSAYDSDIFGFGHSIYESNLKYWKGIKRDWNTQFRSVAFEVTSEFKIMNTAIVKSKVKVGGS